MADENPIAGAVQVKVLGAGLAVGDHIAGTSTDVTGNTSEFGANWYVALAITGTVFETADFTGIATDDDGGTNDAALPNADEELYAAADSSFVATTSTDGAVASTSFAGLGDGTYFVRVRSATIGDAGHLHLPVGSTAPSRRTWPYPLPEMTWGTGRSLRWAGSVRG